MVNFRPWPSHLQEKGLKLHIKKKFGSPRVGLCDQKTGPSCACLKFSFLQILTLSLYQWIPSGRSRNFKEVLYSRTRQYRFCGSIEALIERVSGNRSQSVKRKRANFTSLFYSGYFYINNAVEKALLNKIRLTANTRFLCNMTSRYVNQLPIFLRRLLSQSSL